MKVTDIRVREASASFNDVELTTPFALSGATIRRFSVAEVRVQVTDRRGHRAEGVGAVPLSVPWSWPRSDASVATRDMALRLLTTRLAEHAVLMEPADPFVHWRNLHAELATCSAGVAVELGFADPVPHLAAMLALGAVDIAVHDAWSRCAGRPAWEMYTDEYLSDDLGHWLSPGFAGLYPANFIDAPRRRLPVQHVVGVGDPLVQGGEHGEKRSLEEWLRADRCRHIKIKLGGRDPAEDADRVAAIHRVLAEEVPDAGSLALDANEGYSDPEHVVEMLGLLKARHPDTAAVVAYIEQPVDRGERYDPSAMRRIGRITPVVMDEGLADLADLPELAPSGWSGLVIKASKGQTFALLCHAWARANDMFVVVQDLTAVGRALEHSARLASRLPLSGPAFEYNSRQYAPAANAALELARPGLVRVEDGMIDVGSEAGAGLY